MANGFAAAAQLRVEEILVGALKRFRCCLPRAPTLARTHVSATAALRIFIGVLVGATM
ncbi:MAG: hypothetical protein ACI9W2_004049, partial [Gammaproteobacteria bacterium]